MDDGLHAISPYDGRYKKLGQELAPWFSEAALIKTRVHIEISYLTFLSRKKIVSPFSLKKFNPDIVRIKEIEKITHHDVQAVVVYLQEVLEKTNLADVARFVHFGLTSEDINNLSWRIALTNARSTVLVPSLNELIAALGIVAKKYKALPMLARTHGQPAVPTTFGKEIINYAVRLHEQQKKFTAFQFQGKLNGAVGNFNALHFTYPRTDWIKLSDEFLRSFGFIPNHFTTQVHPNDDVIEYLQIIERINTIVHGFCQDMWRYISDDLVLQKSTGVGSSTMPQKVNPIDFEHSEGVTEIANGLINVLVTRLGESRLQRDLSDTPLFRYLGEIHAATIDVQKRVTHALERIKPNEKAMKDVLNKNWAILAEPMQLLLKKQKNKNAFEKVKKQTQGKQFTQERWEKIFGGHEQLTPETYIGKAVELTEEGLHRIQNET